MAAGHAARFADRLPAIPQDSRMRIFPADRERLVDLEILASLDATSAENALIGIVAVKWVRVVHLVRLRLEGNLLMLDGHQLCGVVYRAIPVVVVADGTIEHVISENPIEGFLLRGQRFRGFGGDIHSGGHFGCTS